MFPNQKMFLHLPDLMEEKEILFNAGMLFMRYGIKSMTMDDIARQLGISKKTLYLYVDNKKDLVKKVMASHIEHDQDCIAEILVKDVNAIDEIMEITKMVAEQMKEMHPSVMFDLKKYHPEGFKLIIEHKDKFIYKNIKRNLEQGIEAGLYRSNLNPELVTRLYLAMVNTIMDPDNFPSANYSYAELHAEMMRYHIRGIASSTGREYLKQKFNQDNV